LKGVCTIFEIAIGIVQMSPLTDKSRGRIRNRVASDSGMNARGIWCRRRVVMVVYDGNVCYDDTGKCGVMLRRTRHADRSALTFAGEDEEFL
jgi:hypothetical protein